MRKITGKKGAPFFEQLCKLADNKMGGWAAYWWPKPGEKTPSRKLSFGMKIEIKGKKLIITDLGEAFYIRPEKLKLRGFAASCHYIGIY
ncbi:MAG: hypothetical protein GY749_18415 [Desulfobacteraceae bacterium]|nr:hypothetical protein [Desulfobacteraceae bacterium]